MITIQDRDQFIKKLDLITEQLYTTKAVEEVVNEILTQEEKGELLGEMGNEGDMGEKENKVKMGNLGEMGERVKQLKEELRKMPVVSLTLASMPSVAMMKRIQEKLLGERGDGRKKGEMGDIGNRGVLLDIKIEPEIIGGAVIAVNGRYGDYSLKKLIITNY